MVVTSASEMPAAMPRVLPEPNRLMTSKTLIMPETVPSSPSKGRIVVSACSVLKFLVASARSSPTSARIRRGTIWRMIERLLVCHSRNSLARSSGSCHRYTQ